MQQSSADSEAGPQPRPQHHLFGRGPSAAVTGPMMKCQLVIVPAMHPHLMGWWWREGGWGRHRADRERNDTLGSSYSLPFLSTSPLFFLVSIPPSALYLQLHSLEGLSGCLRPVTSVSFIWTPVSTRFVQMVICGKVKAPKVRPNLCVRSPSR